MTFLALIRNSTGDDMLWIVLLGLPAIHGASVTKCINFYGLETEQARFVCSWKHPPNYYLDILSKELQVNTVRLPFSGDYVKAGKWNAMDGFFVAAQEFNMTVILDWHRNTKTKQSASPLTDFSYSEWKELWFETLHRYQDYPNLKGVGLYNEFQMADPTYVFDTQFQLVEDLEREFPNRWKYYMGCPTWGTNCSGIEAYQSNPLWPRIMMEVHKYPFNQGAWDETSWDETIPTSVNSSQWFVGEIGWDHETGWETNFLGYLNTRGIYNLCFWTIAHSHDTGGLWQDDCETPEFKKSIDLKKYWTKGASSAFRGGGPT